MRIVIVLLTAILLTGCAMPTPAPTPTPAPSFVDAYEALDAPYLALNEQMNAIAFNDPDWRAETERLAQEWRQAIDVLRDMPQPEGAQWVEAWPVLQAGLDEYAKAAGAIENAAAQNQPALMEPARGHVIEGVNLVSEAMRLLQ